jgi:periplasmic protein TonB
MGNERLALIISLTLHGLLAGFIIAMAMFAAPPPPIPHLDCALLELSSAPQPEDKDQATAPATSEAPAIASPTPPVPAPEPVKSITPRKPEPAVTRIRRQPLAPAPEQPQETPEAPASTSTMAASGTDNTAQPPAPTAETYTSELPAMAADEAYRRANFTAIRNSILGKLHYPQLARRRGWSGQVEISFTITPDGHVSDLHVLTSSGFSLLDDEALTAIRQTAPFSPPPQVAASLTIPITFRLN